MFKSAENVLYVLHFYGAVGIALFGCAIGRLIECPSRRWWPLWFCAGLFVYNLDRLRVDPTDRLSLPKRAEASRRLRPWCAAVTVSAGLFLVGWPIYTHDWRTLAAVLAGSSLAVFYPVPLGRRRLKDVPLLKTFLPPGFVLAAVLGLPLLHGGTPVSLGQLASIATWGGALLLGNMVLCDARDADWDRAAGVISLPVFLGPRPTRALLWGLVAVAVVAGLCAGLTRTWLLLAFITPAYLAGLILAARTPRSERFYERWVEGILYLPALLLVW